MVPAADPIPETPNGAKSRRWFASNAVKATITKTTSTPSLIITMMALTLADSLAPRMSNNAHITINRTAGTFT